MLPKCIVSVSRSQKLRIHVLLAHGYKRKPNADKYWGECSYFESVVMNASSLANKMIITALSIDEHDPYHTCLYMHRIAWEITYDDIKLVAGDNDCV